MSKGCWKLSTGETLTNVAKFAIELGVTRQTIYVWIAKGMPVLRSEDGKILILYEKALKWLEKQINFGSVKVELKVGYR